MQSLRQSSSAARWSSSRVSGQLPTAKHFAQNGADIIKELEELAQKFNLGEPVYKFTGGTSSGGGYFCSVHLTDHQTGSLDEYATQEQAKYAAASNAIHLIKTYYADRLIASQVLDKTPEATASSNDSTNEASEDHHGAIGGDDFEHVAENLMILLSNLPRGIYSHALSLKYLETYKENLPDGWLTRIKEDHPEFMVHDVDASRSIVSKRRVRSSVTPKASIEKSTVDMKAPETAQSPAAAFCDENQATQSKEGFSALSQLPVSSKKEEIKEVVQDKAVSRTTKVQFNDQIMEKYFTPGEGEADHEIIQPPPVSQPPPFIPSEDETDWNVFVSVVKTPSDFMVRLQGEEYSEVYEQLQRDMHEFYELDEKGTKLNLSSCESLLGGVYAARAEECWHRVYLNEIIPADEGIANDCVMASVYFIDHGDYETLPLDDLRLLDQNFMRLSCQAVPACLSGFELLKVEDYTNEMIERFREITLAKTFAAKFIKDAAADTIGELSSPPINSFVLVLFMPLVESEPVPAESSDNEGEAAKEGKTFGNERSVLFINDVIMQMAPQQILDQIKSRRVHNEKTVAMVIASQN